MIEVRTGSRLHFGLLNPGGAPGGATPGERRFGGAGMMIDGPGICIRVEPAASWSAAGPLAERALAFARRFDESLAAATGSPVPAHHVGVVTAPPDHVGLGTGTQLGMAVARALSLAAGRTDLTATDLAGMIGRGLRSAIGVHGFAEGGFLIDGGVGPSTSVAPLIARLTFPADWRVLLILPDAAGRWHGVQERSVFEQLAATVDDVSRRDRLCRVLVSEILPALAERDLHRFGEALHDFNVRAGEPFVPLQGGRFSGPETDAAVESLRCLGVRGVGQSSWGPAVFGIDEAEHARWVLDKLCRGKHSGEALVVKGVNEGAVHL